MNDTTNKLPATVQEGDGYVEITFSDEIPRELIENQVKECQNGTCACCTTAFRENVESFEIIPDKELKVRVKGSITKEQIMENILSCAPKLL